MFLGFRKIYWFVSIVCFRVTLRAHDSESESVSTYSIKRLRLQLEPESDFMWFFSKWFTLPVQILDFIVSLWLTASWLFLRIVIHSNDSRMKHLLLFNRSISSSIQFDLTQLDLISLGTFCNDSEISNIMMRYFRKWLFWFRLQ